ncbi:hypothetical protein GF376_00045 [Candidatus Peregrinibacteria bacterium]|nr:hypothetical protein [Candidatus Peregrinibacteria bacterium]
MIRTFLIAGQMIMILIDGLSYDIIDDHRQKSNAVEEIRPESVQLEVPFIAQAPFGDWSPPFDEACEEASIIMVKFFLDNQKISKEIAENEIVNFVGWQTEQGYSVDIRSDQMAEVSKNYYNINAQTFFGDNVSIAKIEQFIADGSPVILPVAGRMLGNPYYTGEGPPYHVLVVTGYDQENFVTNDPGTRRGESFSYDKDLLYNSIHDWTGAKETIESGRKAMLILKN